MSHSKIWTIYVLRLVNGKYYVGRSNILNINRRIRQHCLVDGAQWTKLYKPVAILEFLDFCPGYVETLKTIEYMRKYGWRNVRGGGYAGANLTDPPSCLKPEVKPPTMMDYWNIIKAEKC